MKKSDTDAPVDRRIQRTRSALRDALIGLIAERSWDEIAVQDICERSNIGRSTFYLHYPNKDALLQGGLDGLQSELQRQVRLRASDPNSQIEGAAGFHFALGLIEHALEQRKVFRSLIGRRSSFVVQQRFREMVIRLVTDELPASTGRYHRDALARWLSGAFVELLSWWIEQRTPLPPVELAAMVNELSRPALDQTFQRKR
jgi:AcrR family transcriptional regulator